VWTSAARTFERAQRLFADPRSWRDADRCLFFAAIALPLVLWAGVTLHVVRAHPATLPYVDARFAVEVILPLVEYGYIGGLLAIVAVALLERRRSATSPLLVAATILWVVLVSGITSYFSGHFTSLLPTIVLVGLGPTGLFYHPAPIRRGVAVFVAIIIGTTIATQSGWIPYGPLYRAAPFADGHLATSWLTGFGGVFFILALAGVVLVSLTIVRARHDQESLARATDELTATNEAIRRANQRLEQAAQDLASAQASLVQTERMASLGQLVAGVSHELSNPASFIFAGVAHLDEALDGIVAMIDCYQRLSTTDPALTGAARAASVPADLAYFTRETPELLRICREGAERIRRITDDLRIFVRVDSGERLPVDVDASLANALRQFAPELERAGIAIVFDERRNVPSVAASPAQLAQVWTSLLRNAIDAVAGRPQPEIALAVRCIAHDDVSRDDAGPTAFVEVDITDNGAGMSAEAMTRAFEPFFTTKPIGHGTGLGLSIAYGVITSHGGELSLASESGHGTRARVRLRAA